MKHPHADILQAIADNTEVKIEYIRKGRDQIWEEIPSCRVLEKCEDDDWTFRIKPEPIPDVVKHYFASEENGSVYFFDSLPTEKKVNLIITFNSGELIKAEVI